MMRIFEWNGCTVENSTTVPWNDRCGTTWNDFEETAAAQPLPCRSGWNAEPFETVPKTVSQGAFRSTSFTRGRKWNDQGRFTLVIPSLTRIFLLRAAGLDRIDSGYRNRSPIALKCLSRLTFVKAGRLSSVFRQSDRWRNGILDEIPSSQGLPVRDRGMGAGTPTNPAVQIIDVPSKHTAPFSKLSSFRRNAFPQKTGMV
jgi:hypothetical protein